MRKKTGARSRRMRVGTVLICAASATPLIELQAQAAPDLRETRIVVGANVQVSRDGIPNAETWIATNPRDSLHLIGAAMVGHPLHGFTSHTYTSRDGGHTWLSSIPAEVLANGGGDPMVAITESGTTLLVSLSRKANGLSVFRSEDQGRTWEPPALLGNGWDHEAVAIDRTPGRHAGRIYIAGERVGVAGRGVYVIRSDDDGRTFSAPVPACLRKGWNAATMSALVLSDGTLLVSCSPYPNYPERWDWRLGEFGIVASKDGGETFTPFQPAFRTGRRTPKESLEMDFGQDRITKGNPSPVLALDSRPVPHGERLYALWSDLVNGEWRLMFSYSADRGRNWAIPKPIAPGGRPGSSQFQQALAVNRDGVVGVLWYDTRNFPREDAFEVYFTASVDGGTTFLPDVRVSSAPSPPRTRRNATPMPLDVRSDTAGSTVTVLSTYARHPGGGDYIGMSIGAGGVFHPFWADSRTGTYESWTARIAVEKSRLPRQIERNAERADLVRLDGKVVALIDPIPMLEKDDEVVIPIRLQNISLDTVHGPFTVEVTIFGDPSNARFEIHKYARPTRVLNADNAVSGKGAVFRYASSLPLPPGAVTEARLWRFRVAGLRQTVISYTVSVYGEVRRP